MRVGLATYSVEPDSGGVGPSVVSLSRALREADGIARVADIVREGAPGDLDLLHLHGLWLSPSLQALRWRRRTGRPLVVSPHGMLDPWALRQSAWKKRLALATYEGANLRNAAFLHALAASERDSIRRLGLKIPVATIPNGVSLPDPGPARPRPICLADETRQVVLFLGRVHPKKGLSESLAAWAQVLADSPRIGADWALVIAGWDDGGHLDALRRQAADMGLADHVHFPGPVFGEEKDRLLSHASAFLLASHSEGLPMAVLEAWSYGLPVFMTEACNIPRGFEAGAAVEIPTDPDGIARALVTHLDDPALADCGAAGRTLVEAEFDWRAIARRMADCYRWAMNGGPLPPDMEDRA